MNVRLRKKVHKVMDLCLDAKDLGNDCFLKYQPHVHMIDISCYIGNYEKEKPIAFSTYTYLDMENNAVVELNKMIDYLEDLIEKSL